MDDETFDTTDRRSHPHDDERGVSEVVGVALLIGIVVLGTAAVLLVAGPQLGAEQTNAEVSQAEQSLTQFDSEAARVARGGTDTQRIDLGLRGNSGTLDVEDEAGHITVEYDYFFDPDNSTEVMNTSMGTLRYERGDTTVGYQGGGVWRSDGDDSVMVSPPEISYRDGTLTMPVVKTTRTGSVHSDVLIARGGATERFPTENKTNRIDGNNAITVTIESRYCRGWEQFFESETEAIVDADCDQNTVQVTFIALPVDFSPEAGVIATSGPGEIRLEGTGAYVDSYNSPGYGGGNSDGVVKAAGDVNMFGSSQIDGDVRSGKNITINSGSAEIDGNANWTERFDPHDEDSITGDDYRIDGISEILPINRLVYDRTDELRARNDNDAAGKNDDLIDGETLDIDGGEATLETGEYYLDTLHLEGETLYLDTTDGDIAIAIERWVKLDEKGNQPSEIIVEGDGNVRFFVASEEKTSVDNIQGAAAAGFDEGHFVVESSDVTGLDKESPRFQVFGPDNFVGAIGGGGPEVTAAIIAPTGEFGPGKFYVKHGELFGAIVTGELTLGQEGKLHFDRALIDEEIPLAPNVPRIEYLYLTENEIEVGEP